jgi:hypothetical protein
MATILIIAVLFLAGVPSAGVKEQKNRYVRVEVTFDRETHAPGGTGSFVISFRPADGIHINGEPPAHIVLEDTVLLLLADDVEQDVDEETEYIDERVPVRQGFSVSDKAPPGMHTLGGSVVYYYCSDEEGWCRKFIQPLEITLTVAAAE